MKTVIKNCCPKDVVTKDMVGDWIFVSVLSLIGLGLLSLVMYGIHHDAYNSGYESGKNDQLNVNKKSYEEGYDVGFKNGKWQECEK